MKVHNKPVASLLICLGAVLVTVILDYAGFFRRFEYITYDAVAARVRLDREISDEVKVVLIDEASLQSLNPVVGRWPWPRAIYSDLLDFFSMAPPKLVMFDILFTETQDPASEGTLGRNDAALVQATRQAANVYHAMQILKDDPDPHNRSILDRPLPEDFKDKFAREVINPESLMLDENNNNYYIPFPELYRVSRGVAVVEYSPDPDGVFRRTSPLRKYRGSFLPIYGLAPFVEGKELKAVDGGLMAGDRLVPVGPDGKTLVNVYGEFHPYSISGIFASLQQIMNGELENLVVDPEEFRDKIVYIGSSAVGVEDLKATPGSPRTPGVFLHASLASNFLLDDFLRVRNGLITLTLIILFSMAAVPSVVFLHSHSLKYGIPLALAAGYGGFYFHAFSQNQVYQLIPPLFSLFASSAGSVAYLLFTEGREKKKVKSMFSQYVSEDVLDAVMRDYEKYGSMFTGVEKDISVMFSDIRSFTAYSDSTTAETVVKMLNVYFSHMSDVILEGKGTIDKYIGDAIMAFWGAPVELPDHADLCVRSAINMALELENSNRQLKEEGIDYEVRAGIGINSGPAIVGNIGSEKKLSYTVIGDAVNLASRLEYMTKDWGAKIIISENTFRKLTGDFPCRVIARVPVRGKAKRVKIFEVMVSGNDEEKARAHEQCEMTNRAFDLFERGEYEKALEAYRALDPCVIRDRFMKSCREAIDPTTGKRLKKG